MRTSALILLLFLSGQSQCQTSFGKVTDPNKVARITLIRHRTDSFLLRATNKTIFKRFEADFGVTYLVGEFYHNYLFINSEKTEPRDIYDLTQHYYIKDKTIGLSDSIAVLYLELNNQFASESNSLQISFLSKADSLKVQALTFLYNPAIQSKLKKFISDKQLRSPYISLDIDSRNNSFFVYLKDRQKKHNYIL